MKKDSENTVLENTFYDHWDSSFGMGPCGFGQGAIDKACGRFGDVYVYYRHEHLGETTYAAYNVADVVKPLTDVESIESYAAVVSYGALAEAKKGPYKDAFVALRGYLKGQVANRKSGKK